MNKCRKRILSLVLVVCLTAGLTGCTTYTNFKNAFFGTDTVAKEKTIKIGVFEPTSGSMKTQGKEEVMGIELAHDLYPTACGKTVELVYADNKSDMYEAEAAIQELITNVAHDLRTPLTSIIGYLELLSGKVEIPAEMQKKYIDIAYAKSKRLEKLIEDLFGFTKMNYGKVAMHVSKVDIVKLLSQLLEEFYPSFKDKNLSYELQSNVPGKVITADGNLLARLFDNLINNAIKYGADGKRVLVQIHAEEEVVTVSVTNYGYVIPADELPLLFNKFYRVEQSRSTNTGGTGLGLAIAKNIVDMHGGTIQVTSDLNGTVFTVRLRTNFDINRENFQTP